MNIIMDIKEAAEKMTKDEFLNSANGTCIRRYAISVSNEDCEGVKCEDCKKEQIKGMKFKGEEETFEVKCIDAANRKELTQGQIYLAKQSKYYTNYYEIDGHTYKKERFKEVEKPVYDNGFVKLYANGNVTATISEEGYYKSVEGEKVEEVIKVRCIQDFGNLKHRYGITKGKIYDAEESKVIEDNYKIINDEGREMHFNKELFEKVTDDVLVVECIDNKQFPNSLKKNKKYKVIEESNNSYLVKNDMMFDSWYEKRFFKPVETPKEEKKEYSVMEVLEMTKGTILKLFPYDESERKIIVAEGIANNKYLYYIDDEGCQEEGVMISSWIMEKPRFRVVEESKPVSTVEAFEGMNKGRTIKSVFSGNEYKIDEDPDGGLLIKNKGNKVFGYALKMSADEIIGQWIIL